MPDRALIEQRLAALQTLIAWSLGFVLVLLLTSMMMVAWVVTRTGDHLREERNNAISCYVLEQLDRSEKSLPSLTYYKHNPAELKRALLDIKRQRERVIDVFGSCKQQ